MLKSTVVGNYPKLPSQKGEVNIRRLLHRFDKKEITQSDLDQGFDQVTQRVAREQVEGGIDLPTDGQIRWDDIVTPFAKMASGFEIGGLIRWFKNNVYYRKPQIVGEIRWNKPVVAENFQTAQGAAGIPIKAVLPAPFSFAKLSDDRHYDSEEKLIGDLVKYLRKEVEALIAAGASHIQFDDPCLPYSPEKVTLSIQSINEVVKGLAAEFWVCYYFGSISKIAPRLKDLQVQVLAADCVSHPDNFDQMLNHADGKNICFGILDARNIKMESDESLKNYYAKIASRFPDAYISPSCGLEFLPHNYALEKVKLIGRTVRMFNGGKNA